MKIPYFSLLVVGFASLVLSGCVTETETVPVAETDQTTKRVHTQEELRRQAIGDGSGLGESRCFGSDLWPLIVAAAGYRGATERGAGILLVLARAHR